MLNPEEPLYPQWMSDAQALDSVIRCAHEVAAAERVSAPSGSPYNSILPATRLPHGTRGTMTRSGNPMGRNELAWR